MAIKLDHTDMERCFSKLRANQNDQQAKEEFFRLVEPCIATAVHRFSATQDAADDLAQDIRLALLRKLPNLTEHWFKDKIKDATSYFMFAIRNEAFNSLDKVRKHKARFVSNDDLKLDVLHQPHRSDILATIHAETCDFIKMHFTRAERYRRIAEEIAHALIYEAGTRPSFSNNETRKMGAGRLAIADITSIVQMKLREIVADHIHELTSSKKTIVAKETRLE